MLKGKPHSERSSFRSGPAAPNDGVKACSSRTRFQRPARTALASAGVAFLLLQVFLLIAMSGWFPEVSDPEYAWRETRLLARLEKPRPFVLMLGSSRTEHGFHAGRMEEELTARTGQAVLVHNFGISAAGPVGCLLNLERLLERGIAPDLLLVEVLPAFLMNKDGLPWEASWLHPGRLQHHEFQRLADLGISDEGLQSEWWSARVCPWFGYRFNIMSRPLPGFGAGQSRCDPYGWRRSPPLSEKERARVFAECQNKYQTRLAQFSIGPAGNALTELLQLTDRKGIPTALVLMPESTTFQSWYSPEGRAELAELLKKLSCRHGTPIIDARSWVADEHFSDGHHLLADGARIFTDRLSQTMLPILSRQGFVSVGGSVN